MLIKYYIITNKIYLHNYDNKITKKKSYLCKKSFKQCFA